MTLLATTSSRWTLASALPQGFQICGQDETNMPESISGSEGADGSSRRVDVLNVNTEQSERRTPSIASDSDWEQEAVGERKKEDMTANRAELCGGGEALVLDAALCTPCGSWWKKQLQFLLYQRAKGYCFLLLKYVEKHLSYVLFWILFNHYYFPLGLWARVSVLGWQDITGIIMPLTQTLEGKKNKKNKFS